MTTAYAFAPLSSMTRPEDRFRYRQWAEVQERFGRAESIAGQDGGSTVRLDELLDQSTEKLYGPAQINYAAAIIISMQLGVVDRLSKLLPKPDWVVGCSLGDVARTVCAGACAFETALPVAMFSLQAVGRAERIGSTVVVMSAPRKPFSADDLAWMDARDLTVSRLSPRMLNVAGLAEGIEALKDKAQQHRWRFFPLLDFPLHSPHAATYTEQALELIGLVPFEAPGEGIRVYSSVLNRELTRPDDFREEFLGSLLLPHNWRVTAQELVANHGVTRFVNIGPCRTLTRLLEEMGQEVWEADEVIASEQGIQAAVDLAG